MATQRSGVSSKCAATSLTFHFGENVCFSQSSGARERNRSRSRPSSLENKWAVRIGGNGLAVFMDEPGTGRNPHIGGCEKQCSSRTTGVLPCMADVPFPGETACNFPPARGFSEV